MQKQHVELEKRLANFLKVKNYIDRISNLGALVIGDVMIDAYLFGSVNRMSPEAPVPVFLTHGNDSRVGGAANVARNIRSLGAKAFLASVIGDDIHGAQFVNKIESLGIDGKACITEKGRKTTVKTRIIKDEEHVLRVDEETTEDIKPSTLEKLKQSINSLVNSEKIDVIIFEDYDKGLINEELVEYVKDLALENEIKITVDPKFKNFHNYKGVDLFKPNFKELCEGLETDIQIENKNQLKSAIEEMHKLLEPKLSLTTLGGDGAWLHGDVVHHFHEKGIFRKVVDVSGAGDTVIATASLLLAAGASPKEMCHAANIAGGLVCEKSGVVVIHPDELFNEIAS